MGILSIAGFGIGGLLVLILAVGLAFKAFYKKVKKRGWLLVINRKNSIHVTENGGWVLPILHNSEMLDATRRHIRMVKKCSDSGNNGLLCYDNILADVEIVFYISINPEEKSVKQIMANLSVEQVNDPSFIEEYFKPKFSEALKTVAKDYNFEDLYTNRADFRDKIIEVIGADLDGFTLRDVAIDELEQSDLKYHSSENILHVEGRQKIAERTSSRNIKTNEILQDERTEKRKKDVESESARLELDRQEEEARAKQNREVRAIKAAEDASAQEKEQEARLRS